MRRLLVCGRTLRELTLKALPRSSQNTVIRSERRRKTMSEEAKDQGLREQAEELLESVLKEVDEIREEADASLDFTNVPSFKIIRSGPCPPEFAHIEKYLPRTAILHYEIEGGYENDDELEPHLLATVQFHIEGLAEDVYRKCDESLRQIFSTTTVIDKERKERKLQEVFPHDQRPSLLKTYAEGTLKLIMGDLQSKLERALNEHWRETYFLASTDFTFLIEQIMEFRGVKVVLDPDKPTREMKRLLAEGTSVRRRFLREYLADCSGAPVFSEFGEHYDSMYPIWKDAKRIYKQNKDRPRWRELVHAAYPEEELDDDLIARLSGRLNDLSEDVQVKLSEKGGNSTPASIALEHAARLCGAQPYQYSHRHLYNIKRAYNVKSGSKNRTESDGEEVDPQTAH
jgi:hypothetical protein